ncbi:MAG TPA: hypothetical protein VGS57_09520 [Thermoanaerobaculia bacterium]|jgi:hypothetical protein|nr:hypothetical protein [Thermoanaerobaculia bacterium]
MSNGTAKTRILSIVEEQPDDSSYDEILHELALIHTRHEIKPMSTVKEQAGEVVGALSERATWDDVMYAIYVRQKIEAGIKDGEEGNVVEQDEVERRFASSP